MKRRTSLAVTIAAGAVFLVVAVLLSGFYLVDLETAVIAAVVMIAVLVGYQLATRPSSRFFPDERIRRIDSRATVWSWVFTLCGVSLLFLMDHFRIFSLTYG
jgi:uncharacterized membrane protein